VAALTVLFGNSVTSLGAALEGFANSARVAREDGLVGDVLVAFGDASPEPSLTDSDLEVLRDAAPGIEVSYSFFDENTGTSRGQNRLSKNTTSDVVVICNPDVVPAPATVGTLLRVLDDESVGMAEAKQLPVEHPRDYAPHTGATSWSSGAFSMVPRSVFEQVGGFDEDTFFLYCDDVDLSWRIRETGLEVVMQPAATVFHDKSLSSAGAWVPTDAERYYSMEAALLLAHKWSQGEMVEALLAQFDASADANALEAARVYRERAETGRLPQPRDPDHEVATFVDGNYARHRYVL
jgi:GT2 family glycosyltransferase